MRFFCFFTILFAYSVGAQSLSDNLMLHYSFNNSTSDQSINGYSASPFNITYGPDRNGDPASAAYFNGINSYIDFPNLAVLKPQLPVSFSFWIKYDSAQFEQQVVFNTSYEENHATSVVFNSTAGTNQYAINYADGQYFYGSSSRRSYVSTLSVDTSEWKHIAIVMNSASDMKIFIDCVETGGTYSGTGGPLQYSLQPGCLGRHDRNTEDDPGYFKGYIDDFRYWDRALAMNEVVALCSSLSVETVAVKKAVVFPNPADGTLNIISDTAEEIAIYDSVGRKIYKGDFIQILDISAIPAGIYLLQLTGNSQSETHTIIVE